MKESYPDEDIMLCFVQGFEGNDNQTCKQSKDITKPDLSEYEQSRSTKKTNQTNRQTSLNLEACDEEVELRIKPAHVQQLGPKRSQSDRFPGVPDTYGKRSSKRTLTIRKTLSSGNFLGGPAGGCGAARSAPSTPLQLEPSPRVERSSKTDRNAVKPLSSSTSSVPATLGTIAAEDTDGASGKQPSKARQKKFQRHFPQVGPEEKVLNYYSCALVGEILLQGHLYITKNYFAFYSNVFGYVTKLLIPTISVHRITKEKVARIIPNAVGVSTRDERHVFGSLLSRDTTYKLMVHVWKAATASQAQELRASEVELDASEYSPEDDSSSVGAETAPPTTPRRESEAIIAAAGAAVIQPLLLTGALSTQRTARGGATRTLLVVLACVLACSALALATELYRVRYSQDELSRLSGHQLYSELTRWRSRLHGQAATELHAFLSANLLLLTKVRQSLEALSGVILTDMAQTGHINDVPNDTGFS